MKNLFLIKLCFIGFLMISCQNEEIVVEETPQETLTPTSNLTSLIGRVSQNPTALDNVIDNSSCFSVVLPVTVIVNNQQIVVSNQTDYQLVVNAINAFSNDDDIVNFVYPISITYQNFQTQVIETPDELDDVLDDCDEDEDFDEIDCIQIQYPITVNVYNTNTQTPQTVTITSNSSLFNFLAGLNASQVFAINYPISVTASNGQTIVINSNSQLLDFIEEAIDDCDDNGNPVNSSELSSLLTSGTWKITYFFDESDQTSQYSGYNFTFNSNGSTQATANNFNSSGTWSAFIDSGDIKLLLNYQSAQLEEINEDWRVLEFSATVVKLKHVSGGNGGTDYLTFTKQ
jgi:hypothetical protein